MACAVASSISTLRSTSGGSFFLALGANTGPAAKRPTRRRVKASSSPANSVVSPRVIQVPSSVPQSSSRVMTSCATSTRRRVR
jgi:hypothetical protein